jgi:hypothetical protein
LQERKIHRISNATPTIWWRLLHKSEHLGQLTQAQLVTEPKEDPEKHDVGGQLNMIEHGAGALVEPSPAIPASIAPAPLRRSASLFRGR